MLVTTSSPFRNAARISRATWHAVLDASGTYRSPLWNGVPADDRRDVADALYDRIVAAGHDPAVWLAIGRVEHQLGTDSNSVLNRNDTRSWTNARSVRDPSLSGWTVIRDAVRRSQYVKYQTVADSLQDGLYRVDETGYAYRKANAVSIIDHTMIWTEGDGPQYAAKMVKLINEWMEEEPPMATPYDHIIPGMIDARSQLATATQGQGGVVRGPYERIPLSAKRGVVVHYRGVVTDVNAGLASYKSDATYHVGKNWARAGEAPVLGSGIMYHIGVDGQGNVYLLRDLDRELWHCGSWPQNSNTLAIQLPLGGNQRATNAQLMALNRVVDAWLAFTKAPDTEVWGHQELSPTDCPGTLMQDFVQPYRNAPPAKPEFPEAVCFTETGACITLGFLGYWRRLEAAGMAFLALGYPLEDERPETRLQGVTSVQRFERGWLVWEPGEPVPYDVRHATLAQIAVLEGDE